MITVIIAGGAGTRLWPLSTPAYPKHLLCVNGDSTLLQAAYGRARRLSDTVYVVTEAGHAHHVREQLPELATDCFIVEPARRNTSGCLLAALTRVRAQHGADEPVAILWADHYVRDVFAFAQSFRIAGKAAVHHNRVVLVGIEPSYPSTGFGYIEKGELIDPERLVYEVASFTEKPPFERAQQYVRSGRYLWNGGYLVGTINGFEAAMRRDCPELWRDYQALLACADDPAAYEAAYLALEPIALDYRFNEKVRDLLMVPATFDWMDLGSFGDMYKAVEHDEQGNYARGPAVLEEVENSFVHNDMAAPVAVIGLDNVVVVNTPHGLLVARKDVAQKIGDISKAFPIPAAADGAANKPNDHV